MRKLYLECLSGISGDMFVAAMLDLGASQEVLQKVLKSIPVQGFSIKISRVKKAGLDACDFDVILEEQYENHDHDMAYLHGHDTAEHVHTEQKHTHKHHAHRRLSDVLGIIDQTQMTERARRIAKKVFHILGVAEAKAHGTTLEEVHFHEVGAIDSIVDIIAAAVCMDNLGIDETVITALHEGQGTVRCAHGILPIPVPAVSNIVSANHLPLHITSVQGELVTPTGAAIAAAICSTNELPEKFTIERIGLGAGKRQYERPSMVRAMLIDDQKDKTEADVIYKMESNIDDCTGENFGYVMDKLLEAGARDVNYMPVFMKKNRPAYQLNVICTKEDVKKLQEIIFKETTTIGIRYAAMERSILKREIRTVTTSLGVADVKLCCFQDEVKIYPEYSSVTEICRRTNQSFMETFRQIEKEAYEQLSGEM